MAFGLDRAFPYSIQTALCSALAPLLAHALFDAQLRTERAAELSGELVHDAAAEEVDKMQCQPMYLSIRHLERFPTVGISPFDRLRGPACCNSR